MAVRNGVQDRSKRVAEPDIHPSIRTRRSSARADSRRLGAIDKARTVPDEQGNKRKPAGSGKIKIFPDKVAGNPHDQRHASA